jgi:hypothetical protein
MPFATIEGATSIRSDPRAFVTAFVRRVKTGLFSGASAPRNRYEVTREGGDSLHFRSAGWWTAIAAGLNEVDLSAAAGRVRYKVRYGRWATFVLALSDVVGLALVLFFVFVDVREYLAAHPGAALPGLSLDQNVAVAWALAIFWGFVWPWVLILSRQRGLRRLTERLIAEVDAAAAGEARRG